MEIILKRLCQEIDWRSKKHMSVVEKSESIADLGAAMELAYFQRFILNLLDEYHNTGTVQMREGYE